MQMRNKAAPSFFARARDYLAHIGKAWLQLSHAAKHPRRLLVSMAGYHRLMAARLHWRKQGLLHASCVQGSLAVTGEPNVSTDNLKSSIVLGDQDALEDLLNVSGDPGPEPTLPPHVATFLGERLQAYYAQLMSEPVPDRFAEILKRLDGKRSGQDGE
jgi:hypothetical protein